MKVMLDEGAYMPERFYPQDAGYDLRTPVRFALPPGDSITIDTGVRIELPKGKCAVIMSKSGLNVNKDITSTGLVDEGFVGSIRVKLYNNGRGSWEFEKGDKISQFVIMDYYAYDLELVDKLDDTERGSNGFGSTGR
jgi:dUTP pyrophosphatase